MPVLGVDLKTINVSAAAQLMTSSSSYIFNYALFSGSENIVFEISGSNVTVKGNTHINSHTLIQGADGNFYGDFECVGPINISGASTNFENIIQSAEVLPMIVIDIEELRQRASIIYSSSKVFSGSTVNVNGIMLVDGDVTISDSTIKGKGTIVATGNIYISGSDFIYDSADEFVCLYSNSNIEVSGSDVIVEGAFYAPNGMIKLNGSTNTFYGALIADHYETLSGSDITVEYDSRVKEIFTNGVKVILIE